MKIYFGIINLMIPLIMIIFGFIFSKNAPKEINKIYGYRTYMSMRNKIPGNMHIRSVDSSGEM